MTYREPGTGLRFELRTNAPGFMLGADTLHGEGLAIVAFDSAGKFLLSRPVQRIDDYNAFEFCCRAIAAERFFDTQKAWKMAKTMKPARCTVPAKVKLPELFARPDGFEPGPF